MKIGIKLANGTFYPILDSARQTGKRLLLSTVRDKQPAVQIDFYRNSGRTMRTAECIGTLVVDRLNLQNAEKTIIDLKIELLPGGQIEVEAFEAGGSGETHRLEMSLNTTTSPSSVDSSGVLPDEENFLFAKPRISPVVPIIIAAFIFLAAALVFLFLFLTCGTAQNKTEGAAQQAAEPPVAESAQPPAEQPSYPAITTPETSNNATPPARTEPSAPPPASNAQAATPPSAQNSASPDTSRKALRTETVRP